LHEDAFVALLNEPGAHAKGAAAPAAQDAPAGHGWQAAEEFAPTNGLKVPAAHGNAVDMPNMGQNDLTRIDTGASAHGFNGRHNSKTQTCVVSRVRNQQT
jgi:hypothetical protein